MFTTHVCVSIAISKSIFALQQQERVTDIIHKTKHTNIVISINMLRLFQVVLIKIILKLKKLKWNI